MNRSNSGVLLALVLGMAVFASALAYGAVAPFGLVRDRLVDSRAGTKGVEVDANLALTADELREYLGKGLVYEAGGSWDLGLVGGEGNLRISGENEGFSRLLWLMVLGENPLDKIAEWGMAVSPAEMTSVEVYDGDLVYSYGESTRVWVSRDLSRLLRVQLVEGGRRWDAVATGRVGESWLPGTVSLIVDGRAYGVLHLTEPRATP